MEVVESSFNLVQPKHPKLVTFRLCFSCFVAAIGMLQFGWNIGVINNPQMAIKQFINETLTKRGDYLSDSKIELLVGVVVAIFAAGGLIGALLAGYLADRFGRRKSMLVNNLAMGLGGSLMLISTYIHSFEAIIIGRFLSGLGSGIYTGLVPVYINEITPVQIRGAFGILSQLGVVTGLFLSEILGLTVVMGNNKYWNILLGLIIIPAILQAILLNFCPSSPKYLFFFKKDELATEIALRKLRPFTFDVQEELNEIKEEYEHYKEIKQVGLSGICHNKSLLMAVAVGVVLHLSQQLCGINNIFYYSSTLFTSVGVSKENSEYSTLGVGGIMIAMTLISIPLIDRAGRRVLQIGGLSGCLVTSVLFTIFYSLLSKVAFFNYLSVISALAFVACFGIGPGSIPWMMTPELFTEDNRSAATAVVVSVNWLGNLVVGLIFPSLHGALKSLIFIPFIVCQILFIIFLYFKMPETKGVTAAETKKLFGNSEGQSNHGFNELSLM